MAVFFRLFVGGNKVTRKIIDGKRDRKKNSEFFFSRFENEKERNNCKEKKKKKKRVQCEEGTLKGWTSAAQLVSGGAVAAGGR